ncbi:unnamed protein product [Ceratitis capitata]|uniref:(Mediterranean fruit fly) hypothetical protein n=1 Tax=Ceratitis capitata TaxID=7213 RepID=A0A811V530_CERCA|nr:unnamed protein product [Ceratitis capitata]
MLQHKSALYLWLAVTLSYAANAALLPRYAPPQYYHYPTPRRQLTIPVAVPQQQQYTRYVQQTNYVQPQQQQQQEQQYQSTKSYYQQQVQQAANVVQKFSAPTLENAAFTSALTNQGYTYGGNGHASTISAARALPSALTLPASIAAEVAAEESNTNAAAAGAIDSSDSSINLKLPLPINIAPIKVQPLPLQAGASFSELANAVTSYGTVYPQRRRR